MKRNKNLGSPIYRKLYWELKSQIKAGDIAPGSRLPTVRELGARQGVAQGTILKTLRLLEAEGLITKRRGAGIFVTEQPDIPLWNPHPTYVTSEEFNIKRNEGYQTLHYTIDWVRPPRSVELVFDREEDAYWEGKLYLASGLLALDREPRARDIVKVYAPAWLLRLTPARMKPLMDPRRLMELGGSRFNIVRVVQSLRPWLCDEDSSGPLKVPEATPVLRRTTIYYNVLDQVLCYIENVSTQDTFTRELVVT